MTQPLTVKAYLAALPPDRARAIGAVRDAVLAKLPKGYEETIEFGMLAYVVPLARYPKTYNGRPLLLAAIGSQKRHMAVYLNGIYADPDLRVWFERAYAATGKKLDAGKSCVRFETLDDLPVSVVGEAIGKRSVEDYIALHEASRSGAAPKAPAAKKPVAKTPAAKKPVAKKPVAKTPAAKKPAAKKPSAKR